MADDIPQWAWDRAQKLGEAETTDNWWSPNSTYPSVIALARYIAAHEEPPVDPLLVEARKLVAETQPTISRDTCHRAYFIANGRGDFYWEMECVLAALKRGIELGKSS